MKCQNCGKNEANTHLKQNINGNISEHYLCSRCAEKLGFGGMFSGFSDFGSFGGLGGFGTFGNILDGFFGDSFGQRALPQVVKCKTCGSTFDDIARSGKLGCAGCYDTFREQLMPSIRRIHGNAKHMGKRSAGKSTPISDDKSAPKQDKSRVINDLRAQMNKAVEKQDYEQAAVLRDRIKELEASK